MRGGKVAAANYFFEPGEVVTRQSTGVIAVKDTEVLLRCAGKRHADSQELPDGASVSRGEFDCFTDIGL